MVQPDSSMERFIDAQHELADFYVSNGDIQIAQVHFGNIVKSGKSYLQQKPNNANMKQQIKSAKFISSVLSRNPKNFKFFDTKNEEIQSNSEEQEIINHHSTSPRDNRG